MANNSIERLVEDRVITVLNVITGVTFYNGDRLGDRAWSSNTISAGVVVAAKTTGKELTPGSGVYPIDVNLMFGSKLHDVNATTHNELFESVRQELYHDTSLQSRLSTTGITVYGATIEQGDEQVDDEKKLWIKNINLKLWVTPI